MRRSTSCLTFKGENLNTPSTFGDRLRQAREESFPTQQDFADAIGCHQNSLSRYENNLRKPKWDTIQKICEVTGVSQKWLLSGTGEMKDSSSLSTQDQPRHFSQGVDAQDGSELIPIPMVEARLSAGYGSLEVSKEIRRYYSFSSSFLYRKGDPKKMVVMQVEGDSMSPEIRDKDIVLIDQSQKAIRLGQIFAVGFEDAIYLKRIDKLPGKVLLKSVNPEYPPVEIDIRGQLGDSLRIIGQVLWVGREY